jgi:hypothetical protein
MMYRTIQIAGHVTAQGLWLRTLADGREVVDLGGQIAVGRPVTSRPPAARA